VEFRLLGPLEVAEHGRVLELNAAKQRALLAILLLSANEVVSAARLIEELWPEAAPRTAAKSIQVYVSGLRKELGDSRIVTRSPGYMLRVEPGVADFGRNVARRPTATDAPGRSRSAGASRRSPSRPCAGCGARRR
jgi:DNA-binding SARP family transcriptional activator